MSKFIENLGGVFTSETPEVQTSSFQLDHLEQLEEKPFPFEAFEGTLIGDMALALEEAYDAPLSASCMVFIGMQGACQACATTQLSVSACLCLSVCL